MKQIIIQNTLTKTKYQTRNLGRDGFFLLAKWVVLLIVLLWPSMEVLAQKKKQSINITSFERHEVSTESRFGNMTDCCADAFACREGERLVGYAFVYHEFDSILSGSLYHFYVSRSKIDDIFSICQKNTIKMYLFGRNCLLLSSLRKRFDND